MTPQSLLPLSEVTLYILLSLAPGAKHGYAIMKDVEGLSRGELRLSTSTLYDALERLLSQGLIERVEEEGSQMGGGRRKIYRLNKKGAGLLAAEVNRMQTILEVAVPRLVETSL